MRVLFTAQDSQTIRDAFGRAKPNAEYASLYAAAVARQQADQIYNLSLTRTATVVLGRGARGVIGVGRVKTPTLAIVCERELEIRNFVPQAYFEVVATANVAGGQFQMRHAPQERIVRREIAQEVVEAAQGFEGALGVRVEDRRQGPPKLHDLPSLQKLCSSRFGWPASKTLEVAQELYDGQGKKIITYPRAEVRYLPENLISDVPKIVAGLQAGKSLSAIPVPDPPIIRKGARGAFHDKGLEGASHYAVIPNVNTVDNLREVWPRLSIDEKNLFDVIARAYLAAVMPDFRYRQTTATLDVRGFPFGAAGRQPIDLGWRAAFPEWQPADEKGDEAQLLPALRNGETTKLENPTIEDKETRPPPRYNEGTLIEAMQNAWRFVDDEVLRERLTADLVRRRVAVIATPGSLPATIAAKAATATIPIIFAVGENPVSFGLVASLARPGGNATGINFLSRELIIKRLGLLHELVPKAVRVAVLSNPALGPVATAIIRDVQEGAGAMGLQIRVLNASNSGDIDAAFAMFANERPDALFVSTGSFFDSRRVQLVNLASHHAVPASYQWWAHKLRKRLYGCVSSSRRI